jgi:arginine decarboxylase
VQAANGKGLFVEHHGATEQAVRHDIQASLRSLVEGRDEAFSSPKMRVRGGICSGEPACALVAAVYQGESWTLTEPAASRATSLAGRRRLK